jgi:hypothetical protein
MRRLVLRADGRRPREAALYTISFSIMTGLLLVALVCNELIKPVNKRWHEQSTDSEPAKELQEATR